MLSTAEETLKQRNGNLLSIPLQPHWEQLFVRWINYEQSSKYDERERGPPAAHHLLYSLQILLIVHPILWMDQDVAWLDWAHGMLWGLFHSRNNTQPDLCARSTFCNFFMLTWKRVRFGFFLYSSLSLQKLPHLPGCRQVYSISPTSISINLTSTSDFCSS